MYRVRGAGPQGRCEAARCHFGTNPDPSLEEIREAANQYPVFRVVHGFRLASFGRTLERTSVTGVSGCTERPDAAPEPDPHPHGYRGEREQHDVDQQ